LTEPLKRAANTEIAGREGVWITKSAHRHVFGRPGTDPLQSAELSPRLLAVGALIEDQIPTRESRGQSVKRLRARPRHRELSNRETRESLGGGEGVGERSGRVLQRLAVFTHEASGERPGTGSGDLLSEDRSYRELSAVHVPDDPATRRCSHERTEQGVATEDVGDGGGVRIEIEQFSGALDRGSKISQILEPEARVDVPLAGAKLDDAGSVRKSQAAPIGSFPHLLDTRDRTFRQKLDEMLGVDRRAVRKPEHQRPSVL
jgi:hypothetical protein